MKMKAICCVGLALSMICVIGCAAKDTQSFPAPAPAAIFSQAEAPAVSEPQSISEPAQPVQDTPPLAAEQAEAADTPVIEETSVSQAAPTTQPTVTENIPSETVHAKTGYVEPEPTPEPEPTLKSAAPANRQAAIDTANTYAVSTYGVETDTGLTLGNSAYRFPAAVPVDASQATLEAKARDMVDFTFQQLMMQAGVDSLADAGFRCSVTIVEDGGSLLVYVLYDG